MNVVASRLIPGARAGKWKEEGRRLAPAMGGLVAEWTVVMCVYTPGAPLSPCVRVIVILWMPAANPTAWTAWCGQVTGASSEGPGLGVLPEDQILLMNHLEAEARTAGAT